MNVSQSTIGSAENLGPTPALAGRRSRKRVWKLALMALIFAAGIVTGAAMTATYTRHMLLAPTEDDPEQATTRVAERFRSRLNLDEEQVVAIRAVVRSHFERMHEFREEFKPRFHAEMDRFHSEVADALTPEQRANWEENFDQIRREIFPPRPGGRRGGRDGGDRRDGDRHDTDRRGDGRRGDRDERSRDDARGGGRGRHDGSGSGNGRGEGRRGDGQRDDRRDADRPGRDGASDRPRSERTESGQPKSEGQAVDGDGAATDSGSRESTLPLEAQLPKGE